MKRKKKRKKKVSRPKQVIIQPSTQLKVVNVHKIQDSMDCDRLYFWKWVLNLIPRKININFWFGSIMHAALEAAFLGAPIEKILKIMRTMSREFSKGYLIPADIRDEMILQFQMDEVIMRAYLDLFKKEFKGFKVIGSEVPFRIKLKLSGIYLVGTTDLYGKENKNLKLVECKTASRVGNDYFRRLKFDKQINSYAKGVESIEGEIPTSCPYLVLRKPGIRVRKAETVAQFLVRLKEDLYSRPDFYFIREDIRFGKQAISNVMDDIDQASFDLVAKYDFLSTEELLTPACWPRNDRRCLDFGTCDYFLLCNNCLKYQLYLQFFQMRDTRYKEEKLELSKKHEFSTKPTTTIRS